MTVSTTTSRTSYTGNGITTAFAFPYKFLANADLVVLLVNAEGISTEQVLTTDYTVSGAGTDSSGQVTMVTAPSSTETLVIYRDTGITQETDYIVGDAFPAETHESALDKLTLITQELNDGISRTIRLPDSSTTAGLEMAEPFVAGYYLRINDTADGVEYDVGTNANQAAAVETKTLTSGQTAVVFTSSVSPAAFYLAGPDVDSGRLTLGDDYTLNTTTKTLTLTESYPAGTKVIMVYVDGNAELYSVSSGEVSYAPSGTGAVTTTVESKLRETVSVKDFGADPTGVTDSTAAIQAAIDSGSSVYIPEGTYAVTALTIASSWDLKIIGAGKNKTTLATTAGNVLIHWIPAGAGTKAGCEISDMTLVGDNLIKVNEKTTLLVNGSGDSPFVGGKFESINFEALTGGGTGVAFEASKMFDTAIRNCSFSGAFSTHILLNGCDINEISNNRFTAFVDYGIIDVSGGSFGSQNRIVGNDFVLGTNTNATFIKSTSRHVDIQDNYLEQQGASGTGIMIDVTTTGAPTYGSNTQTNPYSIVIQNNRLDGQNLVQYAHRINPDLARTIVVKDRCHSSTSYGTSIFDTTNNDVQINYNGYNNTYMEIQGSTWGKEWSGFVTADGPEGKDSKFVVDARHTNVFLPLSATAALRCKGRKIIMPATMTGANLARITPNASANTYVEASKTITVTVLARTLSGSGDNIKISLMSSSGNTFGSSQTIDTQFKKYTQTFTGPAATDTDTSITLSRDTQNGEIEILSVTWEYDSKYEEGTFTPVVSDAVSAGNTASVGTALGRYTKIGNKVHFNIALVNINTSGMTAGNPIFIQGMPYLSDTTTSNRNIFSCLAENVSSTAGVLYPIMTEGKDVIFLYNGTTTGLSTAVVSQITSGTGDLYITGTYEV